MKRIAVVEDEVYMRGLLTCIFDAYFRKTFPDLLLMEGEPLPLFYNEAIHIATDEEKAGRVWRGLQKKISKHALFSLTCCWLSELPKVDEMLFHYLKNRHDTSLSDRIIINGLVSIILKRIFLFRYQNYPFLK